VVFTFPLPNLTHIDWVAETAHVVIEELLELFVTSPMLEVMKMHVLIRRTQMHEPLKQVTLSKLRKLDWADCDGSISLIPCLVAPQLSELGIKITRTSQRPQSTLSSILSPHADHIPLLLEPRAMDYVYRDGNRSCRFGYEGAASLSIREVTKERLSDSPSGRWFPPDIPISFSGVQELSVESVGGCPPLDDVPIERFESLKKLEFVGETDALVPMIQINRGNAVLVPCPDLSEIRVTPRDHYFSLAGLAEALRQRRGADYGGVKTIRVFGKYKCLFSELEELKKFANVVII